MAIIVEDGTGTNPLANSYVSVEQLEGYAEARGIVLIGEPSTLIVRAMDYAESLRFAGERTSDEQPLSWPRKGVVIDHRQVPDNEIPSVLVNAVLVTCVAVSAGRDPLAPIEAGVKRERVDVLEVEYQTGASSRPLDMALRGAWATVGAISQSGANQISVRRA